MPVNTVSDTGSPVSTRKTRDVELDLASFGNVNITLDDQWDVRNSNTGKKDSLPVLQGHGGTRVELSEISLSNSERGKAIQAKLFIADPMYSPPELKTSVMIAEPAVAQEKLNRLFKIGGR